MKSLVSGLGKRHFQKKHPEAVALPAPGASDANGTGESSGTPKTTPKKAVKTIKPKATKATNGAANGTADGAASENITGAADKQADGTADKTAKPAKEKKPRKPRAKKVKTEADANGTTDGGKGVAVVVKTEAQEGATHGGDPLPVTPVKQITQAAAEPGSPTKPRSAPKATLKRDHETMAGKKDGEASDDTEATTDREMEAGEGHDEEDEHAHTV